MRELIKIAYVGLWRDRFKSVVQLAHVDHRESRKCIMDLAKWDISREVRRVAFEYACALGIKDGGNPLKLRPMPNVDQIIDRNILKTHLEETMKGMSGYGGKITESTLLHKYMSLFRGEYDKMNGLMPEENCVKNYLRENINLNEIISDGKVG